MRRCVALLLMLPLAAQAEPIEPALLGGAPNPETRLAEIGADLRASFDAALARYDAEIAAQPHRVLARIARCRFIESFLLEYEYASFADELYEMEPQCYDDVAAQFPHHPEVLLSQLERTYDDEERLATGEKLLPSFDERAWTPGQRARLYTLLANASERLDTERRQRERTAEYARRALAHDVRADVRLVLAHYYQETGDAAAALEALTSPFDGHDPEDNWYLVMKMGYLAQLGERDALLAVYSELGSRSTYYDHTQTAAALRTVGEAELAARELAADNFGAYGTSDEKERFLLALETGTAEEALAAYEAWRDAGYGEDPLGINRFALFVAHPGLPWRARDALGLLGALGSFAALALVWCVPLGLIHYRGLANRQRGAPLPPGAGLGLRHAWLGLSAFTLAGVASLYAAGPIDLFADETAPWLVVADQVQLAKMTVAQWLLGAVLLAFVAQALRRHFPQWWSTDWSIARCTLVAAGVALAFRVPMFAIMLWGVDLSRLPLDNGLWQVLADVDELYGIAATMWIIAVAAPVAEEFLFRGLLLRAALKHVSFPLANVVQALLFAAIHFDLAAAPYLFGCGLAFGWLARSSGGLLAPMIAHAIFNLAAGLVVLS